MSYFLKIDTEPFICPKCNKPGYQSIHPSRDKDYKEEVRDGGRYISGNSQCTACANAERFSK